MTREELQFELDRAYKRGWEDCHRQITAIIEQHEPTIADSFERLEKANKAVLAALERPL